MADINLLLGNHSDSDDPLAEELTSPIDLDGTARAMDTRSGRIEGRDPNLSLSDNNPPSLPDFSPEHLSAATLQEQYSVNTLYDLLDQDLTPNSDQSDQSPGNFSNSNSELMIQENIEGNGGDIDEDDKFSERGESNRALTRDQSSLNKGNGYDEEYEEDGDAEETSNENVNDLNHRKNSFSKIKQEELIENYMQVIEKLKRVRMKNIFLQDRIGKHLRDAQKLLNDCRGIIQEKLEDEYLHQQSAIFTKASHQKVSINDNEQCDPVTTKEKKNSIATVGASSEDSEPISQSQAHFSNILKQFNKEKKRLRKCQRQSREKHGKGPSKTPRLAMSHYHTDSLISKKPKPRNDNIDSCEQSNRPIRTKTLVASTEGEILSEPRGNSSKKTVTDNKGNRKKTIRNSDSKTPLYGAIQKQKLSDVEDIEQEEFWRHRHEKMRSGDIRKSRQEKKLFRKSRSSGEQALTDPMSSSKKLHATNQHLDPRQVDSSSGNQNYQEYSARQERLSQRRTCRDKIRKRKTRLATKLLNWQKTLELKFDGNPLEDVSHAEEQILPKFDYEFSDISLTKLRYGAQMRQELVKTIADTKLPITTTWPLTIKGFGEYFKKNNTYGKVVYTMRHANQVKEANTISRKYKYVMHNFNYQLQQYKVLKVIHGSNMKSLENSRRKWEVLVEDLLARVFQDIFDYSIVAVDCSGKLIPKQQVERFCKEASRKFENFQHAVRVFYGELNKAGLAIRYLTYSEAHGEGVELYEFQHLLQTRETISTQHIQKNETLKAYKKRTKLFQVSYQKQLDFKNNIENNVNDKFQLSGEISCMLAPKQEAVKSIEVTAKKVLLKDSILQRRSGLVPYRHLVVDYENTYSRLGEKRQDRRELQLKYNGRVREVHGIFDKMEEIELKMPELFIDDRRDPVSIDDCGYPIKDSSVRPKTAPPSNQASGRRTSAQTLMSMSQLLVEPNSSRRASVYFSDAQSRQLLEFQADRPKTPVSSLAVNVKKDGRDSQSSFCSNKLTKSTTSRSLEKVSPFKLPTIRPSTAIPAAGIFTSKVVRIKDSLHPYDEPSSTHRSFSDQILPTITGMGEKIPNAMNETFKKSLYSKQIAGENAELAAEAQRKNQQRLKPTAAKTGIVPMITKKNMLTIAKMGHLGIKMGKNYQQFLKSHHRNSNSFERINPCESEVKHWPYQYYTKPSSQLENTSKRRMDVVLGNLVHQPRPISFG